MTASIKARCLILSLASLLALVRAQAPEAVGTDSNKLNPVQPEGAQFQSRLGLTCNNTFREPDGVCTNRGGGLRKLWGSSNRPQFSYFNLRSTKTPRGGKLKSAREISNIIFKQTRDLFDARGVSEIAVFIGQFIDHTLVATPSSTESLPIDIPDGDSDAKDAFNRDYLEFSRSERVRVKTRDSNERPQNSLTSAMDLTNVYGASKIRLNALRTGRDGQMRIDPDGYMPENDRFVNAPFPGKGFFLAGDHRANEHPILTSLHTLFLREHNDIAGEVKRKFKNYREEDIFKLAKKINEAQWQRIVFEEWYPAITGRKLPKYRGFKKDVDPTISLTFSTAAFRVGHTMVGNTVKRFGPGNKPLTPLTLKDAFFRNIASFKKDGMDVFLRGAINSRAQRVDTQVVDGLRNGLFHGIKEEGKNFDLIALNLQRGRDHALPSYSAMKTKFNRPKVSKFRDITKNREVQKKLEQAYGRVSNIEAFPGLLAEDHAPGSSLGPTILKIWEREFRRIRDGDRFYFRNKGALSRKTIRKIPRLRDALAGKDTFRAIILRHTGIKPSELPRKLFFV